jgi:hypothetical protein
MVRNLSWQASNCHQMKNLMLKIFPAVEGDTSRLADGYALLSTFWGETLANGVLFPCSTGRFRSSFADHRTCLSPSALLAQLLTYARAEGENEGVPYFQHEWEGVDENYGDEEEPEGKFYLEEIDDRFNAMDEATSSYGGNVLGRAMPDAFNQFALSGFRGRVDRAAVMPAETTPARVLEAVSGGAERPEEVEFARAVEEHLQTDVFALLERCEAICAARLPSA